MTHLAKFDNKFDLSYKCVLNIYISSTLYINLSAITLLPLHERLTTLYYATQNDSQVQLSFHIIHFLKFKFRLLYMYFIC